MSTAMPSPICNPAPRSNLASWQERASSSPKVTVAPVPAIITAGLSGNAAACSPMCMTGSLKPESDPGDVTAREPRSKARRGDPGAAEQPDHSAAVAAVRLEQLEHAGVV